MNNYEDLNVIEKKGLFSPGSINGGLFSLILIAIGVVLAKNPESAIKTVCYIIGGVTLLFGIIRIILYFRSKSHGFSGYFDLSGGIIGSAIGLFLIFSPETVVSIVPFIVGIIILLDSVGKISHAINLSKVGYDKWWLMLIISLITGALAVMIILNPFESVATLIRVIGIVFIVDGIISLFSYIFTDTVISKKAKQMRN